MITITLQQAFAISQNADCLDKLKNDDALHFFRILTKMEDAFRPEKKALEKAKKEDDRDEFDRLLSIEKEIEIDKLTKDMLKRHDVMNAKVLRLFSPIIDL